MVVINLGIGNPDGMPAPEVIAKLQEEIVKPNVHGYQSYAGIPELRQAIADYNHWAYGIDLNPETEILTLIGSKEGITHISLAFLDEGDQVFVPELAYPAYEAVAKMCKAEVIRYPLNPEKNYEPDWDFLSATDWSKVKLFWMNYPHMPSGAPAVKETFKIVVEMARANRFIVVHDNPYSMVLPSGKPLSILSVDKVEKVAIELNSLSKSFNMADWRIGWAAAREDYIKTILKVKSNVDSGMFKPVMLAAIEALKLREDWFDKLNAEYKERRELVWHFLDCLGCTYDQNQQGLFVWAKVGEQFANGQALVDELLYNHHIFITPGFIFGEKGSQFVRVSLCNSKAVLEDSIKRLK